MTQPRTLGQMVDAGEPLAEVFELLATLAEHRGWIPLGFRRLEIGDFVVTVNGTPEEKTDDIGMPVHPYCASVSRGGMPAGEFGMFGGVLVPGVEQALIDALTHELES